jgi:hypothetical protein
MQTSDQQRLTNLQECVAGLADQANCFLAACLVLKMLSGAPKAT